MEDSCYGASAISSNQLDHNQLSQAIFTLTALPNNGQEDNNKTSVVVGTNSITNSLKPLCYAAQGHTRDILHQGNALDAFYSPSIVKKKKGKKYKKKTQMGSSVSVIKMSADNSKFNPKLVQANPDVHFADMSRPEDRDITRLAVNSNIEYESGIKELITESDLNTDAKLMIISGSEVNAVWRSTFTPYGDDLPFNVSNDETRDISYMQYTTGSHDDNSLQIGKCCDDMKKVKIMSDDGACSLVLAMPNKISETRAELINSVLGDNTNALSTLIDKKSFQCVGNHDIFIPRMNIQSDHPTMSENLMKAGIENTMGTSAIFDNNRDLTGLYRTSDQPFESDYIHMKSTGSLDVDEHGMSTKSKTEVYCADSVTDTKGTLDFDRPYLFATVDENTQTVFDTGLMFADGGIPEAEARKNIVKQCHFFQ